MFPFALIIPAVTILVGDIPVPSVMPDDAPAVKGTAFTARSAACPHVTVIFAEFVPKFTALGAVADPLFGR